MGYENMGGFQPPQPSVSWEAGFVDGRLVPTAPPAPADQWSGIDARSPAEIAADAEAAERFAQQQSLPSVVLRGPALDGPVGEMLSEASAPTVSDTSETDRLAELARQMFRRQREASRARDAVYEAARLARQQRRNQTDEAWKTAARQAAATGQYWDGREWRSVTETAWQTMKRSLGRAALRESFRRAIRRARYLE